MAATNRRYRVGPATPYVDSAHDAGSGKIAAAGFQEEHGRRIMHERKLTIPQAAKIMGIGATSLRRIIAEGRLPVLKILKKVLILESDVESFLLNARVTVKQTQRISNRLPPLPEAVIQSEHLKGML